MPYSYEILDGCELGATGPTVTGTTMTPAQQEATRRIGTIDISTVDSAGVRDLLHTALLQSPLLRTAYNIYPYADSSIRVGGGVYIRHGIRLVPRSYDTGVSVSTTRMSTR